jgi:hypothetical protein
MGCPTTCGINWCTSPRPRDLEKFVHLVTREQPFMVHGSAPLPITVFFNYRIGRLAECAWMG